MLFPQKPVSNATLVFHIEGKCKPETEEKWAALKTQCEAGKDKELIQMWLARCQLPCNKELQSLKVFEGGVGIRGGKELKKELRFKPRFHNHPFQRDRIVLNTISSSEGYTWTYPEINDLCVAFSRVADELIGEERVQGYLIVPCKKDTYEDIAINALARAWVRKMCPGTKFEGDDVIEPETEDKLTERIMDVVANAFVEKMYNEDKGKDKSDESTDSSTSNDEHRIFTSSTSSTSSSSTSSTSTLSDECHICRNDGHSTSTSSTPSESTTSTSSTSSSTSSSDENASGHKSQ
jgi:hypothetical protein